MLGRNAMLGERFWNGGWRNVRGSAAVLPLVSAAGALLLVGSRPVAAQDASVPRARHNHLAARDDADAARDSSEAARRAYNLGHWDEAADGYERAYRLHPDPVLLFDRAQALKNAGKLPDALANYRAYLREQPDAQNRRAVETRISQLEQQLAAQRQSTEPRSLAAPLPTANVTTIQTSPGPTTLRRRWLPWAGAVVTAALAAGALVANSAMHSRYDDLVGTCGRTPSGCSETDINSVRSRRTTAQVLAGSAGVTAVATGLVLYFDNRGNATLALARNF
jgi:tetratricopeptide (TPR) repeat protein